MRMCTDRGAYRVVLLSTPLMADHVPEALARIIRSNLAEGTLPHDDPQTVAARNGSGEPCAACDQPIRLSQIELEAHYRNWPTISFHFGCYRIWEAEQAEIRELVVLPTPGHVDLRIAESVALC